MRRCGWCNTVFDDIDHEAWINHIKLCATRRDTALSIGNDSGTALPFTFVEVEYDPESPWAFNPDATVADTNETVRIDSIPLFGLNPTGWDYLNALTHEESLARVARDQANGKPTVQPLTFWEYRKLFPEGMSREEYGVSRHWIFEYNGTTWSPTKEIDREPLGEDPDE